MKHHNIVLVTCLIIVFFAAMIPAACAEDETNVTVSEDPGTIQMLTIQSAMSLSADDGSARAAEMSGQPEVAVRSYALKGESAGAPDTEGLDWENTLGGSWGDGFFDLQPANDGNYIAAGASGSWDIIDENSSLPVPGYVSWTEAYIVKIDPSDGHIIWHKLIGGRGKDGAMSIRQTSDGGYIFAGSSDSTDGVYAGLAHGNKDGWVVKLDANRAIQWQVMLGGSQNDELMSVRETPERDGYIVAGYTLSDDIPGAEGTYSGNTDMYAAKLDLDGNIVWQKVIGGDKYDFASSAIPASDGGYVVAGYTESGSIAGSNTNHGYTDIVIMKLDADTGNVVWSKLIGGKNAEATGFDNVIQPTQEGYILVAQTTSSHNGDVTGTTHGLGDAWVVRLDAGGNIIREHLLGGTGFDTGDAVQQTLDGSYIMVGRTLSSNSGDVGLNHGDIDIWVVKLDPEGNLLWQAPLGGSGYEQSTSIYPTSDDGFILAALTKSTASGNIGPNHGYEDAWLAKLKPRLVVDVKDSDTSALVPNARVVLTDITHSEDLEINTTSGRAVFTGSGVSGEYRLERGLVYSVKASAEKYRDGDPVDVTFAHDGGLVTLQITALERPAIEKTFSITQVGNPGWPTEDITSGTEIIGTAFSSHLSKNGWTQVFRKRENEVSKEDFGTTGGGLNNATFHFHVGHGTYDETEEIGRRGQLALSWYQTLYPSDVKNKWGNKNKWVFLLSCKALKDDSWHDALVTSHGVFGFATEAALSDTFINQFFGFATYPEYNQSLTAAYYNATITSLPLSKRSSGTAKVIFKNRDQLQNDHLPGFGTVEPDDLSNEYVTNEWNWG